MTGAIMTGMLARNAANPNFGAVLNAGSVKYVTDHVFQPLVFEQLKAVGVTIVLSVIGTVVIAYITKMLVGLRPTEELGLEEQGAGRRTAKVVRRFFIRIGPPPSRPRDRLIFEDENERRGRLLSEGFERLSPRRNKFQIT